MIKDSRPAIDLPLIEGETVLRQADFEQCTGRMMHSIGTLTLTGLRLFWMRYEPAWNGGTTLKYFPLEDITLVGTERSWQHGFTRRLFIKSKTHGNLRLIPTDTGADIYKWAEAIYARVKADA